MKFCSKEKFQSDLSTMAVRLRLAADRERQQAECFRAGVYSVGVFKLYGHDPQLDKCLDRLMDIRQQHNDELLKTVAYIDSRTKG